MNYFHFLPSGVGKCTVDAYLQTGGRSPEMAERKLPAVVICPGGAYQMVSDREGEPVAKEFFQAGYHVFVLRYTLGADAADFKPMCQLAATVAHIRNHAEQWLLDENKIAVCGFSAGGHLAASLGTLYREEKFLKVWQRNDPIRPDAMILGYPVITADEYAHELSIETVSGGKVGSAAYAWFGLDRHVDGQTPPAFLWHTAADEAVPVENSLRFAAALSAAKVPFELHILPEGYHGMSVCTREVGSEDAYNRRWVEWSIAWLNRQFSFKL